MIIHTGMRTDIPAFYAPWFCNRLRAGTVSVRNSFDPTQVTRYRLDPRVVDLIAFCTKNPAPMLSHMELLRDFGQIWHVTITPYGRDVEPYVPPWREVAASFRRLSALVGVRRVVWRYDPIFLHGAYTLDFHRRAFAEIAEMLAGATESVVISFITRYAKTLRNFPGVRAVLPEERMELGAYIVETARARSARGFGFRSIRGIVQNATAISARTSAPMTVVRISAAIVTRPRTPRGCAEMSARTIPHRPFSSGRRNRAIACTTPAGRVGSSGRNAYFDNFDKKCLHSMKKLCIIQSVEILSS